MLTTNPTTPFLINDPELTYRWTEERAKQWYELHGWQIGCNFIPSNAINQLEMWQEETFSPEIINQELEWAAGIGFNTVRVFLHHLVWDINPAGFLQRIEQYLDIASHHGIKTMFVLFDAVWDPFPKAGTQPMPRPGVHNSGWVQCPGYDVLNNPDSYDSLYSYVHGIVSHFKNDERVLIWDLFNEPDNMNLASYKDDDYILHKAELSMQLLKKTINWVRTIEPIQPITMAPWQNHWHCDKRISALDDYMFSHSDIISFHNYENSQQVLQRVLALKERYDRPMMCTEYMARPFGSTFQEILPIFKQHHISAYSWGLVAGKSQTHCPWDSWQTECDAEPSLWFHDIFREGGEVYNKQEVNFLKRYLKSKRSYKLKRVA